MCVVGPYDVFLSRRRDVLINHAYFSFVGAREMTVIGNERKRVESDRSITCRVLNNGDNGWKEMK